MASSSKKKKEKRKDFQKAKLKVGKTKPKASNFTDTSFKSKAVVLKEQSLKSSAPSTSTQFSHHLSLLTSKSDAQRKESLSHLANAVSTRPQHSLLPVSGQDLLTKLLPLSLDGSNAVRTQLLRALRALPTDEAQSNADKILLYVRAGMTHLAVDIRVSAMDMLNWAIEAAGIEVVKCPGGWCKTLKCFLTSLHWLQDDSSSSWSAKRTFGLPEGNAKVIVRMLAVLSEFLRLGLADEPNRSGERGKLAAQIWPLWHTNRHIIPKKSNPYKHLNLFGPPRDEEGEMYEDLEERKRIFRKLFARAFRRGFEAARKQGGEIGRFSALGDKVLDEGLKDEK